MTKNNEKLQHPKSIEIPNVHLIQLNEFCVILTLLLFLYSDMIPNGKHKISSDEETRKRWPTSWWTQYKMLCWRGFKQTKGVLKQGFTIAQILIVTAVVGMIYFQIDMEIYSVRDVMGLVKIHVFTFFLQVLQVYSEI